MTCHKTMPLSRRAKYIGINELKPLSFRFGPTNAKNDRIIYASDNIDIDISVDGTQWFHLFGSRCYKKCEDFQPDQAAINPDELQT